MDSRSETTHALEVKCGGRWVHFYACGGSGGREHVEEILEALPSSVKSLFRVVKVTEIRKVLS